MEDIVSYNTAKKLKERGFPQHWATEFYADGEGMWIEDFSTEEPTFKAGELISNYYGLPSDGQDVAAPTIEMVLKFFRRYKGIHISIGITRNGYYFEVYKCLKWEKIGEQDLEYLSFEIDDVHTSGFKTFEQAVFASIDYINNNDEIWKNL